MCRAINKTKTTQKVSSGAKSIQYAKLDLLHWSILVAFLRGIDQACRIDQMSESGVA
jgi:hypothetical protein